MADIVSTIVDVPEEIVSTVVEPAVGIKSTVVNVGTAIVLPANAETAQAASSISAGTACALVNGSLVPADPTNAAHALVPIVMALQSGLTGSPIDYVQAGDVADGSFISGTRYYVGASGIPSTSPRAAGAVWTKYLGVGKSSSVLALDMGPTINLT